MPPSNKSTGALYSMLAYFAFLISTTTPVLVYQVVVDTIDSSIGAWGQGQDVNVAVLDCEGHELHALCGGMALLMQVRCAAAVLHLDSFVVTFLLLPPAW